MEVQCLIEEQVKKEEKKLKQIKKHFFPFVCLVKNHYFCRRIAFVVESDSFLL